MDRTGNVGRMITMWHADLGHWLEWQFEVPEAADYVIYARYATASEEAVRSLTIDGESPGEAWADLRFQSTGGFCTSGDDWAMKRLGPPVHLTAGPHCIRMTNLGEGLALDYLANVESATVGEVKKVIQALPAQMSRIIRSLENKGDKSYVECSINPKDKRKDEQDRDHQEFLYI